MGAEPPCVGFGRPQTGMSMTDENTSIGSCQFTSCPECAAPLMVYRSETPQIDACGFEVFNLSCWKCQTPLGGIVDPFDDALLLSKIEPEAPPHRLISKAS